MGNFYWYGDFSEIDHNKPWKKRSLYEMGYVEKPVKGKKDQQESVKLHKRR